MEYLRREQPDNHSDRQNDSDEGYQGYSSPSRPSSRSQTNDDHETPKEKKHNPFAFGIEELLDADETFTRRPKPQTAAGDDPGESDLPGYKNGKKKNPFGIPIEELTGHVGHDNDREEAEAHQMADKGTQGEETAPPKENNTPSKEQPPGASNAASTGGQSKHSSIFPKFNPFAKVPPLIARSTPPPQSQAQPNASLKQPNVSSALPEVPGLNTTGGQTLPKSVRQEMEPKLGFSLKDVRVHDDDQSHQANQFLNARGFARGKHVYLGQGQYNPQTQAGKKVLFHELTHVNQGSNKIRRWGFGGWVDKAKKAAGAVVNGAKNAANSTVNAVKSTASTAKTAVAKVYNGAKATTKAAINTAKATVQAAKATAGKVVNGAKTIVSNAYNSAKNTAKTVYNSAKNTAKNIAKGAKNIAKNTWNGAKNIATTVAKGAQEKAKQAIAGTKALASKAKDMGKNVVDGAKNLGHQAWEGAKAAGNWVKENKGILSEIGHTVLDVAGFIPVVGTAADLINAGWYAAEGRYAEAAMSAMSAIPGVGDAFAAGKMGAKMAANAPKAFKVFKAATQAAPMVPSMVMAGQAAAQGDFKGAALAMGSSVLPMAGGKAGQKLLGNAAENGSKVQAFAGNVLARGAGATPNAIGAVQTYQTYEAYQRGEVSAGEVFKSGLYTAMPFAVGRMGRGKPSAPAPNGKTQTVEPHTPSTGKMPHGSEPEMPVTAKSSEPGTFRDKVPPKTQQETPQKTSPTSRQSSQGNEPESQSSVAVKTPETGLVKDKVPPDLRRDYSQPGGKSERVRFQEQSLAKALPRSARVPVAVNPKLEGNTVQVHYSLDKKGRVSDVHIEAGPGATPRDIELHARTVKSMKRYSGMSFHAQKLKDRLNGWVKRNGVPPVGSKAWEAKLEVEKLPHIISDRTERLAKGDLTPKERERLEREVTHLEHQLEGYQKDFKVMDKDPGKGFVAADDAGDFSLNREGTSFIDPDAQKQMSDRSRQVRVNDDGKVIIQHGKDKGKAANIILSQEAGQTLTKDGFTRARDANGFVIFDSKFDTFVPDRMLGTQKEGEHFKYSNERVKEMLTQNPNLRDEMGLSQEQYDFFMKKRTSSRAPEGLTWHHHQDTGRMQLVDRDEHEAFVPHTGGMSIWGGGYPRSKKRKRNSTTPDD